MAGFWDIPFNTPYRQDQAPNNFTQITTRLLDWFDSDIVELLALTEN